MRRVNFRKNQQRKFIKQILEKINCPSLRELINRGFEIPYSTLRNYFNESRKMPENLFIDLCAIAKINPLTIKIKYLDKHWGQIKGGKNGPTKN